MEQMKKPLGKGASIVLLMMIFVLILVGYFFIILKPLLTEISDVQSQTAQAQITLDGLRAQQQKYVQMKQALQETQKSGAVIPLFDNEVDLLHAMNLVMSDASTYSINASIDSGSAEDTGSTESVVDGTESTEDTNSPVLRRSFNIEFYCQNIWQAQKFMDGLSKIPYRSQISAFALTGGDDTPDLLTNIWSSSITGNLLITFYEAI